MRAVLLLLILFSLTACMVERGMAVPDKAADFNAQLGASYLHRGNLEQAKRKLDKALEQDSDNVTANSTYALLLVRLKQEKEAERYFLKALQLSNNDAEISNNYGTYLCRQKRFEEAEKRFLGAAEDPLYRTPEYAYANVGICALEARQYPKSERYLKKALSIQPRFGSALRNIAELYYLQRDYRQSLFYLQRYHKLYPETPSTLLMLARIYQALGDPRSAKEQANKLQQRYPDSPEAASLFERRLRR